MNVFDCNTSVVFNIIWCNALSQSDIDVSIKHEEMVARWEEHWNGVLVMCVPL